MEESQSRAVFTLEFPRDFIQGDQTYAAFLEALELHPGSTPFYERDDGRVYIDGESGRSCSFLTGGYIHFTTSVIPHAALLTEERSIASDVLRAWEVLSQLEPASVSGKFLVVSAFRENGITLIEFALTFDSIPVIWEYAVIEVRDGVIISLSLKLCRIIEKQESSVPLPVRQASVLVSPENTGRFGLRYVPGETGEFHAMWVVQE
jgi:hypothetical protein